MISIIFEVISLHAIKIGKVRLYYHRGLFSVCYLISPFNLFTFSVYPFEYMHPKYKCGLLCMKESCIIDYRGA